MYTYLILTSHYRISAQIFQRGLASCCGNISRAVLFDDNKIVALNKPTGAVVQGALYPDHSLHRALKDHIKDKYQKTGNIHLDVVHRLDKVTSGAMVFTRTSKATAKIQESIRQGLLNKSYICIVHGALSVQNYEILHHLEFDDGRVSAHNYPSVTSKEARLNIESAKVITGSRVENPISLLKINLITGRKHQIRVQLSSLGFPLLGDVLYGAKESRNIMGDSAIALHSCELCVPYPGIFRGVTNTKIKVSAKPPLKWIDILGERSYSDNCSFTDGVTFISPSEL